MFNVKQIVACVITGLASQSALAADTYYSITTMGLAGANWNSAFAIDNSGVVVGGANFGWSPNNIYLGYTAWVYAGGATREIGLTDASHINSVTGERFNSAYILSTNTNVFGSATRYNGSVGNGWSAWAYDGNISREIGLIDAAHTVANTGYRASNVLSANVNNQVIGSSQLYNGVDYIGASAWIYSDGITKEIGFVDAAHTNSITGARISYATSLNSVGQVVGDSDRYSGDINMGSSAWLYDGSTTQEIGLINAAHTNSTTGYRSNYAKFINDAGYVAGEASRYNGGNSTGVSAWVYNGTTSTEIGLTNATHTDSTTGYRTNYVSAINNTGSVAGRASRYNSGNYTGESAWIYNGSTSNEIGLMGAANTNLNTGAQYNEVTRLNNAGQAIGRANRYNAGADAGQSAWFFNGSSTREIGLTDVAHTDAVTGESYNEAEFLNEAGQVAGWATHYYFDVNGNNYITNSAWLFDSLTNTTFSIDDFYTSVIDGYQDSYIHYLGEDGLVLGSFDDGFSQHAFSFSMIDGFYDLGLMVTDNVDWLQLYYAAGANGSGQIIGSGSLNDGAGMAYLLTPTAAVLDPHPVTGNVVPIPASVWLMGSGLIGLLGIGRKRQS